MTSPLDEIKDIRREKLEKWRSLGFDPFGQPDLTNRQMAKGVSGRPLGERALVVGRIRAQRSHGGSAFLDLEDESGKIQIFFSRETMGEELFGSLNLLDLGDFLSVEGVLFKTAAGQLTVNAERFDLLTKSLSPLPSDFYGLRDREERYRQRYLDLVVNSEVKKKFRIRTQVIRELRRFLDTEGFFEVDTPILQPIYGGATAQPFTTHHNALGIDLYLRISDELYLKRLIVGGFEKVYEIGRDFRNEGIDRQHNPEFTMIEFYWAYSTYERLMELTEKMLSEVVLKTIGSHEVTYEGVKVDFRPPWPRLAFRDALLRYGGPDLKTVRDEESLLEFIRKEKIDLDLKGVTGYAPLLDSLYKKLVRPNLTGPLFLTDHPFEMKPLAKRRNFDPTQAASFQLIVAGFELINAYNELNDPLEQRRRWEEEARLAARGLSEYQVIDEDYIRALEYGMPPTAGWGMGIDRLVAILTDSHTIKDVIFFPTLRPEAGISKFSSSTNTSDVKDESWRAGESQAEPSDSDSLNLYVDNRKFQGSKKILPMEPEENFPSRERVLDFIQSKIKNQNLIRHLLAVEAALKALARRLGGNEELWGILGLIHDADWEKTKENPDQHTRVTLEWLEKEGYSLGPLTQALKSHNRQYTKLGEIQSTMEWALECADELTGFIVSVALVRPDKKLTSVEVVHILKKWKGRSFAAAVKREQVEQCEEKLGIKLPEFIGVVLNAMKEIAPQIGL